MIDFLKWSNFKALRSTSLSLGPFNLIVGPNGSGKSSLLQSMAVVAFNGNPKAQHPHPEATGNIQYPAIRSVGSDGPISIDLGWTWEEVEAVTRVEWTPEGHFRRDHFARNGALLAPELSKRAEPDQRMLRWRFFAFDPKAIAMPAAVQHGASLGANGSGLAAVLDGLDDDYELRFKALNDELGRWLPEYDRIQFDKMPGQQGVKSIKLRTREGGYSIPATQLSSGTLLSLTLLTLAYLPEPPEFIALEDVDRGIHPRLLRDVQAAMYRLAYPGDFGDQRTPVQVIATTHSPYLLDLYKNRPEQIIIAHKKGNQSRFERLSDREDINDILNSAPLGEVWYSGVLGGVPGEQ